jgi:transposase-like protein
VKGSLRDRCVRLNRTGFPGGPDFWKDGVHDEQDDAIEGVSGGVRERAVRLVREQEAEHATRAAAIRSVAAKVGCHAETLRLWRRDAERDDGPAREEQARLEALERENRELRQAGGILRKASAYFARAEPSSG